MSRPHLPKLSRTNAVADMPSGQSLLKQENSTRQSNATITTVPSIRSQSASSETQSIEPSERLPTMTAKKETYNSQPRLHAHDRNAQYLRSAAQHSAARHNTKQLTDQSINQSINHTASPACYSAPLPLLHSRRRATQRIPTRDIVCQRAIPCDDDSSLGFRKDFRLRLSPFFCTSVVCRVSHVVCRAFLVCIGDSNGQENGAQSLHLYCCREDYRFGTDLIGVSSCWNNCGSVLCICTFVGRGFCMCCTRGRLRSMEF